MKQDHRRSLDRLYRNEVNEKYGKMDEFSDNVYLIQFRGKFPMGCIIIDDCLGFCESVRQSSKSAY